LDPALAGNATRRTVAMLFFRCDAREHLTIEHPDDR
jgi:hypothetical protein